MTFRLVRSMIAASLLCIMEDFDHNEVIMAMVRLHLSRSEGIGNYIHRVGGHLMVLGDKRTGWGWYRVKR